MDQVEIYAHRGRHVDERDENTMQAVRVAIFAGMGVEVDVRFSKDGDLVCVHDFDLLRTHGLRQRVKETSTISLVNIGVATLYNVFQLASRFQKKVIVDVKLRGTKELNRALKQIRQLCHDTRCPFKNVSVVCWSRKESLPRSSSGITVLRGVWSERALNDAVQSKQKNFSVRFIDTPKWIEKINFLAAKGGHVNVYFDRKQCTFEYVFNLVDATSITY